MRRTTQKSAEEKHHLNAQSHLLYLTLCKRIFWKRRLAEKQPLQISRDRRPRGKIQRRIRLACYVVLHEPCLLFVLEYLTLLFKNNCEFFDSISTLTLDAPCRFQGGAQEEGQNVEGQKAREVEA